MEENTNTNQNNQGVDFKSLPKSAIVIAVICGVGIIGTFLPWVTASAFGYSNSVSGVSAGSWGWLTLVGFAASAASVLFGKQMNLTPMLGKNLPLYTGGAATLFCVITLIRVLANSSNWGVSVSPGFGLFVSLIAGAALLLVGLNVIKIK